MLCCYFNQIARYSGDIAALLHIADAIAARLNAAIFHSPRLKTLGLKYDWFGTTSNINVIGTVLEIVLCICSQHTAYTNTKCKEF
jgi:hypothetical protein